MGLGLDLYKLLEHIDKCTEAAEKIAMELARSRDDSRFNALVIAGAVLAAGAMLAGAKIYTTYLSNKLRHQAARRIMYESHGVECPDEPEVDAEYTPMLKPYTGPEPLIRCVPWPATKESDAASPNGQYCAGDCAGSRAEGTFTAPVRDPTFDSHGEYYDSDAADGHPETCTCAICLYVAASTQPIIDSSEQISEQATTEVASGEVESEPPTVTAPDAPLTSVTDDYWGAQQSAE